MSDRSQLQRTTPAVPIALALALIAVTALASGCGDNAAARSPASASVPSGSAATPTFARSAEPAVATTGSSAAPSAPSAALSAEPSPSAEASAEPASSAEASAELPNVEIRNIGMHIGGEDNTPEQKRPIRNAVSKHYDDMRRCYALAEKPSKETTFGVDMRIGREGGLAKISNPRSGFKSSEVKSCLVEVFEKVEFPKAKKRIAMMVSFSVRFRRK